MWSLDQMHEHYLRACYKNAVSHSSPQATGSESALWQAPWVASIQLRFERIAN